MNKIKGLFSTLFNNVYFVKFTIFLFKNIWYRNISSDLGQVYQHSVSGGSIKLDWLKPLWLVVDEFSLLITLSVLGSLRALQKLLFHELFGFKNYNFHSGGSKVYPTKSGASFQPSSNNLHLTIPIPSFRI